MCACVSYVCLWVWEGSLCVCVCLWGDLYVYVCTCVSVYVCWGVCVCPCACAYVCMGICDLYVSVDVGVCKVHCVCLCMWRSAGYTMWCVYGRVCVCILLVPMGG